MKFLKSILHVAIAGSAALAALQPSTGIAQGFDPTTGRVSPPVRQIVVETVVEPGDAERKSYASKHKHRHAHCDRGGPERGDEVGCGKKIKDRGDDDDNGNSNANGNANGRN